MGVAIDGLQLRAGGHDEIDKLMVLLQAGAVMLAGLGCGGGQEPAAHSFGGNEGGESLVEIGVARNKKTAVGQFVEDNFRQGGIGFGDESV